MTMAEAYDAAHTFAAKWHAGQVDKAGRPYLLHLEDVARRLIELFPDATIHEVQAALLHDVLEDTACTPGELEQAFGADVARYVRALTKPAGVPYLDAIRALVASGITSAIRVKLADNLSNSDPARIFTGSAILVASKYEPARIIIEKGLLRR
jgi:(p)ppGpp synthase/HD superfamily hydrolase